MMCFSLVRKIGVFFMTTIINTTITIKSNRIFYTFADG